MLEVEFPIVTDSHGLVRVLACCRAIIHQEVIDLHFFFMEKDEDVIIMDMKYNKEMFDDMIETASLALNEMYYNRDVFSHLMSKERH
jgi:hypothetical protein